MARVRNGSGSGRGRVLAPLVAALLLLPLAAAAAPVAPPGIARTAAAAGPVVVAHPTGPGPVVVDTSAMTAPRGLWIDKRTGTTVDAGSVPKDRAARLDPPDTGDGAEHDWMLVVVDTDLADLPAA
jgi:hypothetical protein